jgi:protein-tyrosine-phosphatase
MSVRTRAALLAVGLEPPAHRSRQLTDVDLDAAHLVVAMEGEHVAYVRRRHPGAAPRTATLRYLARRLRHGEEPLPVRVAELRLEELDPRQEGDVTDPAGGDEADYVACARDLSVLMAALMPRLAPALSDEGAGDAAQA